MTLMFLEDLRLRFDVARLGDRLVDRLVDRLGDRFIALALALAQRFYKVPF